MFYQCKAKAIEKSESDVGAEVNSHAKKLEENAYLEAGSEVLTLELKTKYDINFDVTKNAQSPTEQPETTEIESLNPNGDSLGDFTKLTFHKDGLFSTIYKATPKPSAQSSFPPLVALKVTTPSLASPPHSPHREASLLSSLEHPNIIPLLSSFTEQTPLGTRFILTLPYLPHDLETLLRTHTLPPSLTPHILSSLFRALSYLHSQSIIHRDIKPSNILLSSPLSPPNNHHKPQVQLIDFSISYSSHQRHSPPSEPPTQKITDVGTTHYRPPELLFGDRAYTTTLDLWPAGCILAECIRPDHRPLFTAGAVGSELALISSMFMTLGTPDLDNWPSAEKLPDWGKMRFKEFPRREWSEILGPGVVGNEEAGAEAVDLVGKLVRFEAGTRLRAEDALNHPFFKNADTGAAGEGGEY
ncbi:MAG: hypothetical protein Q9227_006899 [Pyrenula ochraceoflavens]